MSALQLAGRERAPTETLVLTIASIEGGTAANVIASKVTLRGTLRWLDPTVRDRALARMEQIATGVCAALRVNHDLRVPATLPVLRCKKEPTALLADAATSAGATVVDPRLSIVCARGSMRTGPTDSARWARAGSGSPCWRAGPEGRRA